MSEHVERGKITSVRVGMGGYQDVQMGVWIGLGGKSWGCGDGRGMWAMEPDPRTKWTRADQIESFGKAMDWLCSLLKTAGKQEAQGLIGTPIEATFDGPCGRLSSWRIMEEVL